MHCDKALNSELSSLSKDVFLDFICNEVMRLSQLIEHETWYDGILEISPLLPCSIKENDHIWQAF